MDEFEEYRSLPDDPELAFVEYVKLRELERESALLEMERFDQSNDQEIRLSFITKVLAFHDAHGFDFLNDPELSVGHAQFHHKYNTFVQAIKRRCAEIIMEHAIRLKKLTTAINIPTEIKQQLHRHIEDIRKKLIDLNIRDDKKEALLSKLAAFSKEVDFDRTKLESWTSFGIEVAKAGGKIAKELKPVKGMMDSISNLLGKAADLADKLGLPSPEKPKQIEGPKKQLPKPDEELNDEIPF